MCKTMSSFCQITHRMLISTSRLRSFSVFSVSWKLLFWWLTCSWSEDKAGFLGKQGCARAPGVNQPEWSSPIQLFHFEIGTRTVPVHFKTSKQGCLSRQLKVVLSFCSVSLEWRMWCLQETVAVQMSPKEATLEFPYRIKLDHCGSYFISYLLLMFLNSGILTRIYIRSSF